MHLPCIKHVMSGHLRIILALLLLTLGVAPIRALEGAIGIHDPSTVAMCDVRRWVITAP